MGSQPWEGKMHLKFWPPALNIRHRLEDMRTEGRIIVRWMLE